MEKNNEVKMDRWVDDKLTKLDPGTDWQPNAAKGLARFEQQRAQRNSRGQRWRWAVAVCVAACVSLFAFASPRQFAQNLWNSPFFKKADVSHVSASVKTLTDGKPAPDFTLKDATGHIIQLSTYKGRVVLLNFWATWCEGCLMEMPWFMDFQKNYESRGLTVIGISMDDDGWKSVKPYITEKHVNYPVVIGNQNLGKLYGLNSMPMTLLIDRNGKIAASYTGVVDKDLCDTQLNQLMNK